MHATGSGTLQPSTHSPFVQCPSDAEDGLSADEPVVMEIATQSLLNGSLAIHIVRLRGGRAEVVFANDAFVRLTGFAPADVIGHPCTFLRGPDSAPEQCAALDRAFEEGSFCDVEILHYRRDGSPFWNGVTVAPAPDSSGVGTNFLVVMRDVTARRRADDRLAALANRLHDLAMQDPLTGIANRRSFDAMLEREWRRAARTRSPTTLAMIDIDHFKSFNDRLGHPAGDSCLRMVARALESVIRQPADFVARYGGEEFAVLMPGLDAADALAMASRLVQAVRAAEIEHPCAPSGWLSISCGVVTAHPHRFEGGVERFMRGADQALYRAKAAGRNQVHQADASDGDA
jgi:diguanylate cyclase (GGDEF)-like protein/PAS domain S-box-containing protein